MRFGYLLLDNSFLSSTATVIHSLEQALDKFAWAGPLFLLAGGTLLYQTARNFPTTLPKVNLEIKNPDESNQNQKLSRFLQIQHWLPLLFLVLIAVLHFAPLFSAAWTHIRADYDEGVHTMAATLLAQGHWPYRDFFFTQPPAALYNLLPAGFLGGGGPTTLWLARATAIAWGVATTWLLFVLGRKVWNWQFGCAALLIYGLDGIGVFVGHQALLEQIRNGWGLLAIWAFLNYLEKFSPLRRSAERWLICAGACSAIAFLSKVDGVAIEIGLLGWCFLSWVFSSQKMPRKFRLNTNQKLPFGKIGLKLFLYFAITSFLLTLPFLLTSGGSVVRQVFFFQLLRPPDGITPDQRFDAYAINPGDFQVGGNAQLTLLLAGLGLLCWLLKFRQLPEFAPKLQALLITAAIWLSFQLAFFSFSGSFFVHYYLTILPVLALAGGGLIFLPSLIPASWRWLSFSPALVKNLSRVIAVSAALVVVVSLISAGTAQLSTLLDSGESDGPATIASYVQSVSPPQATVQTFDMLDNLLSGRKLPSSGAASLSYMIDSYGSLLYTAGDVEHQSWLTLLKHVITGKERQQNYHPVILNSVTAQQSLQNLAGNSDFTVLDERGADYSSSQTKQVIAAGSVQVLNDQPIMLVYANEQQGALLQARQWLLANIARGSKIWVEPASLHLPGDFQLTNGQATSSHTLDWFASQNYDYLILSSNNYDRYFADPAKYSAEIAAYRQLSANLIATFNGSSATERPLADEPSRIDVIAVRPRQKALLNLSLTTSQQTFQLGPNIIKLNSYALPSQIQAGQTLPLLLSWQRISAASLPADTKLFVHLLNTQGQTVAQRDNLLGENLYPASDWTKNQLVVTDGDLTLPPQLSAGSYQVEIGIYLSSNGQRFLLGNSASSLKLPLLKLTK